MLRQLNGLRFLGQVLLMESSIEEAWSNAKISRIADSKISLSLLRMERFLKSSVSLAVITRSGLWSLWIC